jgi:hypothetical protein
MKAWAASARRDVKPTKVTQIAEVELSLEEDSHRGARMLFLTAVFRLERHIYLHQGRA